MKMMENYFSEKLVRQYYAVYQKMKGENMKPVISCIRMCGTALSSEISEHLAIESIQLYWGIENKRDFGGNSYDGRIWTDREPASFFGLDGICFEAEIKYEAPDKSCRNVSLVYIMSSSVLGMAFQDGYEFILGDIKDMLEKHLLIADVISSELATKQNNDNIGKTIGSC
jgi:hypothetical protein